MLQCRRPWRLRGSDPCDEVRAASDWLAEEEPEAIACGVTHRLRRGYRVYRVGPSEGVEVYWLVGSFPSGTFVLAELGAFSSGNGNRSEWLRGVRAVPSRNGVTLFWREDFADVDLGFGEFNYGETCAAIRCTNSNGEPACSAKVALRAHGATRETTFDEENHAVRFGRQTSSYDWRAHP